MRKLLRNRHFWLIITLFVVDALFFGSTDPNAVPSVLLIVGYSLLITTLYWLIKGGLQMAGWYGLKVNKPSRLARVVTAVIGTIIALQSIGELGPRDIFVLMPLALVAYLYISYGRAKQGEQP